MTQGERINNLEDRMKGMDDTLGQILFLLQNGGNNTPKKTDKKENVCVPENEDIPVEPKTNQSIRLKSLFVGKLNLNYGNGKTISFSSYGQEYPVLYKDLIDIINMNRKFSEMGYFYILNQNAVYYLGLRECYKKLLSFNDVENICKNSKEELENILSTATKYQKELIVERLAMKIHNGEDVDRNVVDCINKILHCDIEKVADNMNIIPRL